MANMRYSLKQPALVVDVNIMGTRNLLDYHPTVSLADGLSRFWGWYKENVE